MSTVTTYQTDTTSSEQTEQLGEQLGQKLKGSEVFVLTSDLGGGKTTFVRGLARGMGSSDHVASPTFTVSREYKSKTLTLHHFDFYRLDDPGIVTAELAEVIDDRHAVVAVEWPSVVKSVLPAQSAVVTITTTGEDTRHITVAYPDSLAYLFSGVN